MPNNNNVKKQIVQSVSYMRDGPDSIAYKVFSKLLSAIRELIIHLRLFEGYITGFSAQYVFWV